LGQDRTRSPVMDMGFFLQIFSAYCANIGVRGGNMEEEYKVASTILHLDFPAILKAHQDVINKIRIAEKTIETKTLLVKKRKEKLALIGRRVDIINKMPSNPGTLFHLDSSLFVIDQKKITRQIKADQTTIETKFKVVRILKETLAELEKQIQITKNVFPPEK
jgi:hypothetical protein